jgi:hypothetical protein
MVPSENVPTAELCVNWTIGLFPGFSAGVSYRTCLLGGYSSSLAPSLFLYFFGVTITSALAREQ